MRLDGRVMICVNGDVISARNVMYSEQIDHFGDYRRGSMWDRKITNEIKNIQIHHMEKDSYQKILLSNLLLTQFLPFDQNQKYVFSELNQSPFMT